MTPAAADNDAGRPAMDRRDVEDLSMLADGSLPPGRRDEVEAKIAATPGASALLADERRAVEAVRGVASVHAPDALRERIAADRARAAGAPGRRRVVLGGALAGSLAVVALALVLVLTGGGSASPSVSQAASLALRGASSVAPPPAQAADPAKLARNVDDVYFPARLGTDWHATGERVDRIGGRVARTIYYRNSRGAQIAYTIVGGPALAEPRGATLTTQNNIAVRSVSYGGRLVVTWRHDGHTCILSGRASDAVLIDLAAWKASV